MALFDEILNAITESRSDRRRVPGDRGEGAPARDAGKRGGFGAIRVGAVTEAVRPASGGRIAKPAAKGCACDGKR